MDPKTRHPATEHLMQFFAYAHLPPDLQEVSQPFKVIMLTVVDLLPDGRELTTCLRKLLEAKDCAVRARILHGASEPGAPTRRTVCGVITES
jgi:hypothetical protein